MSTFYIYTPLYINTPWFIIYSQKYPKTNPIYVHTNSVYHGLVGNVHTIVHEHTIQIKLTTVYYSMVFLCIYYNFLSKQFF